MGVFEDIRLILMDGLHYFIALLRTKPGLRDFPKRGVEFLPKQVNL